MDGNHKPSPLLTLLSLLDNIGLGWNLMSEHDGNKKRMGNSWRSILNMSIIIQDYKIL